MATLLKRFLLAALWFEEHSRPTLPSAIQSFTVRLTYKLKKDELGFLSSSFSILTISFIVLGHLSVTFSITYGFRNNPITK